MAVNLRRPDPSQLFAVAGVELGVAMAGIKKPGRKDLLVTRLAPGAAVAGVFTQNRLCAAPVVLATTTRILRDIGLAEARAFASQSLRGVMLVVPFAAVAAGSAHEVVPLIFGGAFAPASGAFSILIYGAVALLFVLIASAILIAANRPGLTFAIVAPLVPIAVAAHVVAIPRWHAVGAAAVTAGVQLYPAAIDNAALAAAAAAQERQQDGHDQYADLDHRLRSAAARTTV